MKKILILILVISMFFAFPSCSNRAANNSNADKESTYLKKDNNFSYDKNDNIILCDETPYYGYCDYCERLALSVGGQYDGLKEQYYHKQKQIDKILSSYHLAKDNSDYLVKDCDNGIAIVKYLGKKLQVEIPDTLEGKPVTMLCGCIEKETTESGLLYYYRNPFAGKKVKSILIPNSLKFISKNALYTDVDARHTLDNPTLEKVIVADKNPYYFSKKGLLYNKNMTALLHVPDNYQSKSVVIPDGVKVLYSVISKETQKVRVPKTVEKIELISPFDFFEKNESDWTVNAYCTEYNLNSIEVVGENKSFSSENGVLYNKEKSELIAYPYAKHDKEFAVPESVITIGEIDATEIRHLNILVVGKETENIKMLCDPQTAKALKTIKGYKGTAAEKYAKKNGFKFVALDK